MWTLIGVVVHGDGEGALPSLYYHVCLYNTFPVFIYNDYREDVSPISVLNSITSYGMEVAISMQLAFQIVKDIAKGR